MKIVREHFLILLLIAIYFPCLAQAKTRLALEGLFAYIGGFYFSCRPKLGRASGSGDIQEANDAFVSMHEYGEGT